MPGTQDRSQRSSRQLRSRVVTQNAAEQSKHGPARSNLPDLQARSPSQTTNDVPTELLFYDRSIGAGKRKICPFSDATRPNPCQMQTPRARKDQITHHLLHIKLQGGDDKHPLTDPLWECDEMKYYWLVKKPPKLAPGVKKMAQQRAGKKVYKKRLERQNQNLAKMTEDYESGRIDADAFRKILVGAKRRNFDMKVQIDKKLAEEKRVRDELEKRILEMQQRRGNAADSWTSGNDSLLAQLEKSLSDLQESSSQSRQLTSELLRFCTLVANAWGNSQQQTGLTIQSSIQDALNIEFPSNAEVRSYFEFAALLIPFIEWTDTPPRSDSIRRQMARSLTVILQDMFKDFCFMMAEDVASKHLEGINGVFTACCDVMRDMDEHTETEGIDAVQNWSDEQDRIWNEVRMKYLALQRFQLGWQPPFQFLRIMDSFVNVVQSLNTQDAHRNELQNMARAALGEQADQGEPIPIA